MAGATDAAMRRAETTDIAAIMALRASVTENRLADPSRVTAADVARFVDVPGIWLRETAGEIVGFSAADPADGSIWALFVRPGHEGRGHGRALIAAACADLRAAGHRRAVLGTDPGTRAERFYRVGGWTDTGRRANGEIAFARDLGDPRDPPARG